MVDSRQFQLHFIWKAHSAVAICGLKNPKIALPKTWMHPHVWGNWYPGSDMGWTLCPRCAEHPRYQEYLREKGLYDLQVAYGNGSR